MIKDFGVKIKPERRYWLEDFTIRYDNKENRICIFIDKAKNKHTGVYSEEKIEDGSIIRYTIVRGHHPSRNYLNQDDRDRYEIIYIKDKSLMQLFGEDFKYKSFTLEQLKDLEKQINEKAESAYYRDVFTLILDDSYTGKARQLLGDEVHIAKKYRLVVDEVKDPVTGEIKYVIPEWICIEKQYLNIKVDKDNNLVISFNDKMKKNGTVIETIKDGSWRLEELPLEEIKEFDHCSSPFSVYTKFRGFSRTALRKIVEKYRDRESDEQHKS